MKNKFLSFNLDFLGFSASFLCAIHCALLPILLTFSALSGLEFLEDPMIEYGMILLSLVLASTSLYGGYKKHHKKLHPIITVLLGFAAIGLSRIEVGEVYEATLMTLGGFTIAFSHFWNFKLQRKYSCAC